MRAGCRPAAHADVNGGRGSSIRSVAGYERWCAAHGREPRVPVAEQRRQSEALRVIAEAAQSVLSERGDMQSFGRSAARPRGGLVLASTCRGSREWSGLLRRTR